MKKPPRRPRQKFIVICENKKTKMTAAYGTYSNFKRAEGDATAFEADNKHNTYVLPIFDPNTYRG